MPHGVPALRAHRRKYVVGLAGLVLGLANGGVAAQSPQVHVDPRIELLSLAFRYAGAPEYDRCAFDRFQAAADAWFRASRDDPAIELTRKIRQASGVAFDAIPSLAVHVDSVPSLQLRGGPVSEDLTLDDRWRGVDLQEYLTALRDFARRNRFQEFLEAEEPLLRTVTMRLRNFVDAELDSGWFPDFFGTGPEQRGEFHLVPGLCLGGANYGPRFRAPDGREEMYAVVGVSEVDSLGLPTFSASTAAMIVHEFSHSFVNPATERSWPTFRMALEALLPVVVEDMGRLGYRTPKTILDESLVRAVVIRYLAAAEGQESAREELFEQLARGFVWMEALLEQLDEYERSRDRYETFEAFLPHLGAFWDSLPARLPGLQAAVDARRPRLVASLPRDSTGGIDPATSRMTLRFDRPMRQGWSLSRSGSDDVKWPMPSGFSWNATRTELTFTVELSPEQEYAIVLTGLGLRSEEGMPLKRTTVEFRTRARPPE